MKAAELLDRAEEALQEQFQAVEKTLRENLARVLRAFRDQRVGSHHFAGVSGYGHDDQGRQVLDRVFAQIMGCEAAVVRLQMVSGTHAIACALFGVLRPGDELLSITAPPPTTPLRRLSACGAPGGDPYGSLASVTASWICGRELSIGRP